ncbi:nuclear pore complex assembly-domain-containing protein [Lentinula raphanica]|uniref:Nuclear pore complex assembly-domain-containing protein n=1 Tax=Lentinula raphanica TaxID=153919 RepID=A0AA38P7K9_9AGAR|nr:nuclear pore complex assembly-domain-containing protein [Lentinula raphanica]KAJ3969681.1 nuclear pore complex assembly-domain-containing protein [Lentinula raphanica]
MDVDSSDTLAYFDVTDELFPWHNARVQEIERRRAMLDDTLLYDIMLSLGGIQITDTLYPPLDAPGLHRLLNAIAESTYDALKKDCLVYFLLKWYKDGRERKFQRDRLIPPQFARLAEAYWYLDAAVNIPIAVSLLSDARLNQDYSSKIMQAISTATDIDPHPLIVRYVRTAKPILTELDDLELYLVALAHHNLFEAWQFQRSFSQQNPARARLFKKLLEWCVSPGLKANALTHLLTIPLTSYEVSLLHSYATFPSTPVDPEKSPPSLGLATLQNLSCTRLIQTGHYADAIKLHRQFSAAASSNYRLSSEAIRMTQQRKDMIDGLYSTLPSVERTLLDAELKGTLNFSLPMTNGINGDTSMSDSQTWEEVHKDFAMDDVHMNGVIAPQLKKTALPMASTSSAVAATPKAAPTSSVSVPNVPSSFSLTSSTGPGNRDSLASSRSGAPRFGGAPPILPISGGGDSSIALSSSLGFGGIPSLSSSTTQNHTSLGGPNLLSGRKSLPFDNFNTSAGGLALSTSGASGSNTTLFTSSKGKPNAFYKPPIINNPAPLDVFSAEGFEPELGRPSRRSTTGSHSPERPPSGKEKQASEKNQNGHAKPVPEESSTMEVDYEPAAEGLNYSLFGSVGEVSSGKNKPTGNALSAGESLRTSQKRPPGAFTDDEDEDMTESVVSHPPPRQTRSRKSTAPPVSAETTGTSASAQSSASASGTTSARTTKSKGNKKPRQTISTTVSTHSRSKRRVPGGMSDDDDDDDDGLDGDAAEKEVEDQVAPLASTRRTTRKTRSSAAAKVFNTEESGPKRRSSRISTSGEVGGTGGASSTRRVTRKSTIDRGGNRKQR